MTVKANNNILCYIMLSYQEFKEKYKKDNKELKTPNKDIHLMYRNYKYEEEMKKKYVIIKFYDNVKINFN